MSYSSLSESNIDVHITVSKIEYKYHPDVEKFIEIDNFNIVQYLFNIGLLTDIECRKVVLSKNVLEIRAAIYKVMITKDTQTVKKILEVFRNCLHPVQNPKILLRIFSHLKWRDLARCMSISPDWREIITSMVSAKHYEVNLDQFLLMNLPLKEEKEKENKKCHIFHSYVELKAFVFQRMLAINPEKYEIMFEMLQIGIDVPPDVNNSSLTVSCMEKNRINNLISNALNNLTILSNIFKFLSFTSIKNCRPVRRTWNTACEPFIRKASTIKFDSGFRPLDFLNVSKYLPLPNVDFKSFKFLMEFEKQKPGEKCSTAEFFTKYGKNIRSLDLSEIVDIRSYLSQTTSLTELHLQGSYSIYSSYNIPDTMAMIPLNSIRSIKILCLTRMIIKVDLDNEWERITPLKVHFNEVSFFVNEHFPPEITLNDYIDFTEITDVKSYGTFRQTHLFDWTRDTFVAEKIALYGTRFVNTEESKSSVNCLELCCPYSFSEKISVLIKEIIFEEEMISLDALPISVEKLAIYRKDFVINRRNEQVNLPNLNYLCVGKGYEFSSLSQFRKCPNLTDMEIWVRSRTPLDVRCLSRNIKRLKVNSTSGQLNFVSRSTKRHRNLDLLILDFIAASCLNNLKFNELRPKVLVLKVRGSYEDEVFVSFIRRNKNMNKIYVQLALPQSNVFNGSQLSSIVDKESQYYEFNNEIGKAITSEEFFTIQKSLEMKTVMKEFWNTNQKTDAEERKYLFNHFRTYYEDYSSEDIWSENDSSDS